MAKRTWDDVLRDRGFDPDKRKQGKTDVSYKSKQQSTISQIKADEAARKAQATLPVPRASAKIPVPAVKQPAFETPIVSNVAEQATEPKKDPSVLDRLKLYGNAIKKMFTGEVDITEVRLPTAGSMVSSVIKGEDIKMPEANNAPIVKNNLQFTKEDLAKELGVYDKYTRDTNGKYKLTSDTTRYIDHVYNKLENLNSGTSENVSLEQAKTSPVFADVKKQIEKGTNYDLYKTQKTSEEALKAWWESTKGTAKTLMGMMATQDLGRRPGEGLFANTIDAELAEREKKGAELMQKGAGDFMKSGKIRQNAVAGEDFLTKAQFDVVQNIPDMAISAVLAMTTGGGGTAAKAAASEAAKSVATNVGKKTLLKQLAMKAGKALLVTPETIPLALKSFAMSYQDNLGKGLSEDKALTNALIKAYGEGLLEKGGVQSFIKAPEKGVAGWLASGGFEGSEEITQDVWSNIIDNLYGQKVPILSEDSLYSGLIGAITGWGVGAPMIVSSVSPGIKVDKSGTMSVQAEDGAAVQVDLNNLNPEQLKTISENPAVKQNKGVNEVVQKVYGNKVSEVLEKSKADILNIAKNMPDVEVNQKQYEVYREYVSDALPGITEKQLDDVMSELRKMEIESPPAKGDTSRRLDYVIEKLRPEVKTQKWESDTPAKAAAEQEPAPEPRTIEERIETLKKIRMGMKEGSTEHNAISKRIAALEAEQKGTDVPTDKTKSVSDSTDTSKTITPESADADSVTSEGQIETPTYNEGETVTINDNGTEREVEIVEIDGDIVIVEVDGTPRQYSKKKFNEMITKTKVSTNKIAPVSDSTDAGKVNIPKNVETATKASEKETVVEAKKEGKPAPESEFTAEEQTAIKAAGIKEYIRVMKRKTNNMYTAKDRKADATKYREKAVVEESERIREEKRKIKSAAAEMRQRRVDDENMLKEADRRNELRREGAKLFRPATVFDIANSDIDNIEKDIDNGKVTVDEVRKIIQYAKDNNYLDKARVDFLEEALETSTEQAGSKEKDNTKNPIDRVDSFIVSMSHGENISLEAVNSESEYILTSEDEIKASLKVKKNDELTKMIPAMTRSSYKTKDEMVDKIYDTMLSQTYYLVSGSDTLTYSFGDGNYLDVLKNKVKKALDELTEEKLSGILAKNKADHEERLAKKGAFIAGIENPKTLDDYKNKKRFKGLTPEEQDTYEDLLAVQRKKDRETSKEREHKRKAATAFKAVGDINNYMIEKSTHSKTGEDVWVVRLPNRIESEEWKTINSAMKSLGGNYWSGNKGWNFKYDPTEKLKGNVSEEIAARAEAKAESRADKLRTVAENMQDTIEDKFADRLANTKRRARMAASAEADGAYLQRIQATMRNIADAIDSGEVKLIGNIDSRAQIETLEQVLSTAKYRRIQEAQKLPENKNVYDFYQAEQAKPISIEDIRYAEMPLAEMHIGTLKTFVNDIKTRKGLMLIAKRLDKLVPNKDGYVDVSAHVDDINKIIKEAPDVTRYTYLEEALASRKRLARMGIESLAELKAYLREYMNYREGKKAKTTEDIIKEKQRSMIGMKIEGYFPTPPKVVGMMVEAANLQSTDEVLEPSAGQGHIADLIKGLAAKIDVAEWNNANAEILKLKGYNIVGEDALKIEGQYDKVIMNPPFENGQDIDHVRYAYDNNLKPGGRIVAIMSEGPFYRNDKKATAFREWLDSVEGTSEKLPEGSFKESDRSTGVNTRLVIIDKPAEIETMAETHPANEYQQKRDAHNEQAKETKRLQTLGIEKTGVRLQDAADTGRIIEAFNNGTVTQEQLDEHIDSLIRENRISDKSVLGEERINKALKPAEAKPESKSANTGYHAGDLGKAERFGNFYGSVRDTGHFGTGTYFVGEKSKLDLGSYKDRPLHEVDLSGYNLFKPVNANDAGILHDMLKYVNNYFEYRNMKHMSYYEVNSLKGDPEKAYEVLTEYGVFDEEQFKTDTGYTYKEIEEGQIWNRDIADAFKKQIGWLDNLNMNIGRAENYKEKFDDNIERLLNVSPEKADSILQSIYDDVNAKMQGKNFYNMGDMRTADSISTQFMKALGYEGVDVRHIPQYDNTSYGTVVYDLRENKKSEPAKIEEKPADTKQETKPETKSEPKPETKIEETKQELKEDANYTTLKELNPNQKKLYSFLNKTGNKADAIIEGLVIPKSDSKGFDGYQKRELVEGLIKGLTGEKPFDAGEYIHVKIPDDGTFDIVNKPSKVAVILDKLGVKINSTAPKGINKLIREISKGRKLLLRDELLITGYGAYPITAAEHQGIMEKYGEQAQEYDKNNLDNILEESSKKANDGNKVLMPPIEAVNDARVSSETTKGKVVDKGYLVFTDQDGKHHAFLKGHVDFVNKKGVDYYIVPDNAGGAHWLVAKENGKVIGTIMSTKDGLIDESGISLTDSDYFRPTKGYVEAGKAEAKPTTKTQEYNALKKKLDELIAKKATASEEEAKKLDEQISSIRLNLQLFGSSTEIGSAKTGKEEVSKFYKNSILNSVFIPDSVKDMLDEIDFVYATESNEGQLNEAADNIENDMQYVIDRIKNCTSLRSGTQTAEALLITKIYLEEGNTTGDYSKVLTWLKTIRPKITKTAQSLQAVSMFKRFSTENTLMQASKAVEESRTKKDNKKIDEAAEKIKEKFDKAEQKEAEKIADDIEQTVKNVTQSKRAEKKAEKVTDKEAGNVTQKDVDDIDPVELLIFKIKGTLKEPKVQERDPIMDMVNELFNVAKESPLPTREFEQTDPIEFIADAIRNRQEYRRIWLEAKERIKAEYEGDSEVMDMLSAYFEKGIKPTFSAKTLDKAMSKYVIGWRQTKAEKLPSNTTTTLSQIVRDWYATGRDTVESMVNDMINKAGLSEDEARTLEKYIRNRVHEATKRQKEIILAAMFKEAPPMEHHAETAIEQMTNMGAFKNTKYMAKAMAKLKGELRTIIRKSGLDMGKLAKQSIEAGKFNKLKLIKLLSEKLQVGDRELKEVLKVISQTFDEILGEKKQALLSQMLKERKKVEKKGFYEKIVTVYNLGGFTDTRYRELIANKFNLPALTDETIQRIIELTTRLQSIPAKGLDNLIAREKLEMEILFTVKNIIPASIGRKISTVQAINQLLNIKTNARNILGNEFGYRAERGSVYLASLIDWARSKIRGTDRKITFKKGTRVWEEATAFGKDFLEAARAALKGYKLYGYDPSSDSSDVQRAGQVFHGKWNPFKYLETALNLTLSGFDYSAAMRGLYDRVAEMAYVDGLNKGLKGDALKKHTREYADNLSVEMFKIARECGDWITFKDKDSVLGNLAGGMKRTANIIGINSGEFGLGDVIAKYARTGGVLLARSLEYSPFGIGKTFYMVVKAKHDMNHNIESEKDLTREIELNIARSLFGTIGFTGLGILLASLGIITGEPDDDKIYSNLERIVGLGAYKINVSALFRWIGSGFKKESAELQKGDVLFSYDWALPVSLSVGLGANIQKSVAERSSAGKSASRIATGVVASLEGMMNMFSASNLMQGVTNMFRGYDAGENIRTTVQNMLTGFTGTLLYQTRQLTDNTYRVTEDEDFIKETWKKIKNRIPGMSKELPEQIGIDGYKKEIFQNSSNNVFNVMFNPGFVTRYEPTPGIELMLDLFKESRSRKVLPDEAPATVTIDKQTIPLTQDEINLYQMSIGYYTMQYMDAYAQDEGFLKLSREEQQDKVYSTISQIGREIREEIKLLVIDRLNEMGATN